MGQLYKYLVYLVIALQYLGSCCLEVQYSPSLHYANMKGQSLTLLLNVTYFYKYVTDLFNKYLKSLVS